MISFLTNASATTLGGIAIVSGLGTTLSSLAIKQGVRILSDQDNDTLKKAGGAGLVTLGLLGGIVSAGVTGVVTGLSLSTINPILGIVGGVAVGLFSLALNIYEFVKSILAAKKNNSENANNTQEPTTDSIQKNKRRSVLQSPAGLNIREAEETQVGRRAQAHKEAVNLGRG